MSNPDPGHSANENPGARAGATGADIVTVVRENQQHRIYHRPEPAASFLLRRFGLTGSTARTVAALAWGAV